MIQHEQTNDSTWEGDENKNFCCHSNMLDSKFLFYYFKKYSFNYLTHKQFQTIAVKKCIPNARKIPLWPHGEAESKIIVFLINEG